MRTFFEKIDDLKDFIQYAENNFAIVTYDTKRMQQIILHHLKKVDEYLEHVDFRLCNSGLYPDWFKRHLTTSEKKTSYLLKNLEKIIPEGKPERDNWAELFNFNRESFSDGVRNTIFLVNKKIDDLLFHHAKDVYSWFIFRISFSYEKDHLMSRRYLNLEDKELLDELRRQENDLINCS